MIRKATEKDIPAAMELFTAAKSIMRSDGNSAQWGDGYPDAGIVRTDISMGGAHIIARRKTGRLLRPAPLARADIFINQRQMA